VGATRHETVTVSKTKRGSNPGYAVDAVSLTIDAGDFVALERIGRDAGRSRAAAAPDARRPPRGGPRRCGRELLLSSNRDIRRPRTPPGRDAPFDSRS
jgi:hypothetical protein